MSRLVYCATPARIKEKTDQIVKFVAEHGHGPLHPFLALPYQYFEHGKVGKDKTMEFCLRLVEICDEFWLFGIGNGTLRELCHALHHQKPVRLFPEFDPDWHSRYDELRDKYNDPLAQCE